MAELIGHARRPTVLRKPGRPQSKMIFIMPAVLAQAMEVFSVGRATVRRALERPRDATG